MRVDFTKEMKRDYTILAPDIFPNTHMRLFEAAFRLHGYHLVTIHYAGREVIDTGLKYLHNDMCYPAICALGQQLHALTCGDFDPHKCALLQFQTGGGCRASNYVMLLRKALEKMDMGYVPVIALSFGGYEKYSGFKPTPAMLLLGVRVVVYGDMLLLLKNQTLPYEKHPGDTQALVDRWVETLYRQFADGKGTSFWAMRKNLAAMAEDFHNIPRIERDCVKVGIVGEIYVKYAALGNNGLEDFLLSQGCEYMVPGVLAFIQYMFCSSEIEYKYYGKSALPYWGDRFILRITKLWEAAMRSALAPYPEFIAPASLDQLRALSAQIVDPGVRMGEGWLLPGESAELIEKGYSNIICAQPFGCLPNHIVGKGTIRRLRELYPDANIFPVDYDASASKVNQENRIKLMLAIAREKEITA